MLSFLQQFNMSLKNIFITIDDAPSIHMHKKVDFLKKQNISALFYARGEFVEQHSEQIVYAIKNDFLIGNHSYSHPHFSTISLTACFDEIKKTEKLLDQCYAKAKIKRPMKIMRFPFGDRGGTHEIALQQFLKIHNFMYFDFSTAFSHKNQTMSLPKHKTMDLNNNSPNNSTIYSDNLDTYIDSLSDWDTLDYKSKYIQNPELYRQKLELFFNAHKSNSAVILMHDFEKNHHLFEITMDFLLSKNIAIY